MRSFILSQKKFWGTKVTLLGELIVTQVQEKLSIAKVLAKEGTIKNWKIK